MSIKKRFLFSVGANIVRAGLSLAVGLLVARGLGPADYGNLAYLLGSFWASRALLDMGMASAFYTFIAQKHRGRRYYLVYFGWLTFQFLFSVGLVALLLPSTVVDRFWLGHPRELILLAFLATFLQNQIWQTVVQIHEAARQTIKVQMAGLLIICVHLLLVVLLLFFGWLEVRTVLWAIIAEYLVAAVWLAGTLQTATMENNANEGRNDETHLREVLSEYFHYCRPMIVISIFTFTYEMADRWLLQHFGGASQQGFFQVASQLSTISLLATTSILNILWKEVAEACKRGEHARVIQLHQKSTRLLILLTATISCFLGPWSEQLVAILLGDAYHAAWLVLLLMLFYPIHQAMGQINGTLFMATGQNTTYMKITVAGLLVSMPVSYLLIAPESAGGLEMGAIGLAIKVVGINLVFVNIQSWLIARYYRIAYHWQYQVTVILALLALGFFSRGLVQSLVPNLAQIQAGTDSLAGLLWIALSRIVYLAGLFILIMRAPSVIGLNRHDVNALLNDMRHAVR